MKIIDSIGGLYDTNRQEEQTIMVESFYKIIQNSDAISRYIMTEGKFSYEKACRDNDLLAIPGILSDNGFIFEDETIDFIKYCRQNDPSRKYDILSNGDIKLNSLHAVDLAFPIVVIAENAMLPITLNLLSSYIYNRIQLHRNQKQNVKVSIIIGNDKENKRIDYNGPAEHFEEIGEVIKNLDI